MPLFLIFLSSCHFLRLTHDILILMMGFWWYLHLYGKNIGDESRKRTSEYQMSSSSKTQKTSFQFKKMLIWEHRRKEKMCCQGLPPCRIITDLHRRQRWVRVFQYQCFCFLKEKKNWQIETWVGNGQSYKFPDWKPLGTKFPDHLSVYSFWKINFIISFQFMHFVWKLKIIHIKLDHYIPFC